MTFKRIRLHQTRANSALYGHPVPKGVARARKLKCKLRFQWALTRHRRLLSIPYSIEVPNLGIDNAYFMPTLPIQRWAYTMPNAVLGAFIRLFTGVFMRDGNLLSLLKVLTACSLTLTDVSRPNFEVSYPSFSSHPSWLSVSSTAEGAIATTVYHNNKFKVSRSPTMARLVRFKKPLNFKIKKATKGLKRQAKGGGVRPKARPQSPARGLIKMRALRSFRLPRYGLLRTGYVRRRRRWLAHKIKRRRCISLCLPSRLRNEAGKFGTHFNLAPHLSPTPLAYNNIFF